MEEVTRHIRGAPLWMIVGIWALGALNATMLYVHLVPYALSLGLEPQYAALVFGLFGGGMVAGRVVFGFLASRIRIGYVLTACVALHGALTASLPLLAPHYLVFISPMIGLFFGGWLPLLAVVTQHIYGPSSLGGVLGLINGLGFGLGGIAGPPLAGYVYDSTGSYEYAFYTSALLMAVSALLALRLHSEVSRRLLKNARI